MPTMYVDPAKYKLSQRALERLNDLFAQAKETSSEKVAENLIANGVNRQCHYEIMDYMECEQDPSMHEFLRLHRTNYTGCWRKEWTMFTCRKQRLDAISQNCQPDISKLELALTNSDPRVGDMLTNVFACGTTRTPGRRGELSDVPLDMKVKLTLRDPKHIQAAKKLNMEYVVGYDDDDNNSL